jgi:hypothetical protein
MHLFLHLWSSSKVVAPSSKPKGKDTQGKELGAIAQNIVSVRHIKLKTQRKDPMAKAHKQATY